MINSIIKCLGPNCVTYVYDFIQNNKHLTKKIKIASQLNTIGNYVHLLHNGDYSKLIGKIWTDLVEEYQTYVSNYKKTYDTINFDEKHKIIWDSRIEGIGYYWVDLETEFNIDSMVRMEDCGRVNYGNTTLELREQKPNRNVSHIVVVYEKNTGNIKQIKGKKNSKPSIKYYEYIGNLLTETNYSFNEYIPTYKPENDLLISDLPLCLQFTIYSKHPNLKRFKKIT